MSLKYRRHLRKNSTNPEIIIWQKLRNRQTGGFKFKRQYSIGKFIVDFYCAELNLIIEIDGDIHAYKKESDKTREIFLENRGLKAIHYTNHEVRNNLIGVLKDILRKGEELKKVIVN